MLENVVIIIGLILTVLNIINMMWLFKSRSQEPQKALATRVAHLEDEMGEVRRHLSNDNLRIEELERGNRVLMKSIGALLSHGIDGNNIDEMKVAREELNDFLISR